MRIHSAMRIQRFTSVSRVALPALVVLFGPLGCGGRAAGPSVTPTAANATTAPTTPHAPPAVPTPTSALLALSKADHTLAIVDPATLHVLARIPVGDDPHEVIASEDGARAYVSNYGFGALHSLAVIDLGAQAALAPIDLGALRGPHGLTAVGGKIWFTAEAAKAIGRFDPASAQIDWIFGTGQDRTHMLHVSSDLQRVVTTNVSSASVSIIDHVPPGQDHPPGPPPGGPAGSGPRPGRGGPPRGPHGAPGGDWHETVVAVGGGAEGFDVSPDGNEAWVVNAHDGTISIVDLGGKRVTQTLAVDVAGGNRLRFTIDGKRALVSAGSDVAVFDVASRALVKRITIGHGSAGIVMSPDGTRAFVACGPDDYVAVIDLATLTMVSKIDVGGEPDGLAWATRR